MKNSQGDNFTANVNKIPASIIDDSEQLTFFDRDRTPIAPTFIPFATGSVRPQGWIKQMMQKDLKQGLVGSLDKLYPGIVSDDLYRTARRGGLDDVPEMGDLVLTGADWEQSIMWWNAETTGNWWDGFIRYAFLTEDASAIEKSHRIVQNLLDSQDPDGYIGIYKPNLRYQHEGSNGELWAQTTAFRALLAYYEFTENNAVLEAVERGLQLTMKKYGAAGRNPFLLKNAFGGVTHGLMMTDVCETLHRITGKKAYQDYASYLYRSFSSYSINRSFNDLRYPYLIEEDSLFEGHAVHTYEHIRSLANAYYHTGYPELELAYDNMLEKLSDCILPSGAGHGNEWISKKTAHPDHTAAEYCGMVELRNSYGSLIQKTGKVVYADAAEKLTYNAMLGARNFSGDAITYSKPDNCTILNGMHHETGDERDDPRYKYSPTHSEPAVCCAPNYGRNLSYFLDQMWMKDSKGIAAIMYGPSELTTEWNGTEITITQETSYPLADEITFIFNLDREVDFRLYLRKPQWASNMDISGNATLEGDFYVLEGPWKDGDTFNVRFNHQPEVKQAHNHEFFVQRGPLVFAYPIAHEEKTIKQYDGTSFRDYYCLPKSADAENLKLAKNFQFISKDLSGTSFYEKESYLEGELFDAKEQRLKKVKLVPMGKTILRKVTFPAHKHE